MFESGGTLKHLAFFEELAGLEESDSSWRAVTAGLVVLRLVDAWIEEGPKVVTADAWGVRAVRSAIADVKDGTPVRGILESIVDALETSRGYDLHSVAPRLIAYGQALEYDAKFALAADVYRTLISHTHPIEDSDIALMAHIRLGLCLRDTGDLNEALDAYETAGRIAASSGDMIGVVRASIGEARIALHRGNLPRAEQILDDAIARATGPELREVRARALHDRSTVAHHRGQFDAAIKFAYDALEASVSVREKDRILADIAVSFMELGVLSAARDAYLVLAATAQEQYVRWVATLNLMDIAGRELVQPAFEGYRRELESAALPPHMAVSFELMAGQAYQRFGHGIQARAYLERARAGAEEHGFAKLVFEADEALLAAERDARRRPEVSAAVPEELVGVADYIRQLGRTTVGVG